MILKHITNLKLLKEEKGICDCSNYVDTNIVNDLCNESLKQKAIINMIIPITLNPQYKSEVFSHY